MNPTPEQVEYLKRGCGTRRFIYNWGREQWEQQYQAYKAEQETVPEAERQFSPPNALALKKQFHAIRAEAYPWTYEVTKCVVEGAFDDLGRAYANFFAGRAEYPKYKKKGKSHESFYLSNDKFTIGSHWIAIPGLGRFVLDQRQTQKDRGKLRRKQGTVNLAEKLRFVEKAQASSPTKKRNRRKQVICDQVKILGATVSCEAGHWYVSIQVDIKQPLPTTPKPVVGVDVGLKTAAVVSDGRRLENQKPLALHLQKLSKLQRKLSKKQKTKDPETGRTVFSQNYQKQRVKVARKHQQIAALRRDVQHKFTTELAQTAGTIGIEDLNPASDDGQPETRACRCRRSHGATLAVLEDESRKRRRSGLHRLSLVSLNQTLLWLWTRQKAHATQASDLSLLGVWVGHRSGSQRCSESGTVCTRYASPPSCVKVAVLGSGYDR